MDLLSLRKRREKFSDQGGQRTGLLDARNVAGIPDDLEARAYKFDIVLRGRRASLFENRPEGN